MAVIAPGDPPASALADAVTAGGAPLMSWSGVGGHRTRSGVCGLARGEIHVDVLGGP
jgi:hypothetical protein